MYMYVLFANLCYVWLYVYKFVHVYGCTVYVLCVCVCECLLEIVEMSALCSYIRGSFVHTSVEQSL